MVGMNKTAFGVACLGASLVVGLVACKRANRTEEPVNNAKSAEFAIAPTPIEAAPTAAAKDDGWRMIPNATAKLQVDAPRKWLDNGMGGAAGMHIETGADFMLNEMAADDAGKTLAEIKTDAEAMLFQKWVTAKSAAGVTTLVYNMDKISMQGDEPVKSGTLVAFEVRRAIDGKPYKCYGSAPDQATADEAVALCLHVRVAR